MDLLYKTMIVGNDLLHRFPGGEVVVARVQHDHFWFVRENDAFGECR